MMEVVRNSPNMFFARKFDPTIDIRPLNDLEQSLGGGGGLDSNTPGDCPQSPLNGDGLI